eukprot:scaffold1719_cov186-Amphora_coffeaeformis.AAC.2
MLVSRVVCRSVMKRGRVVSQGLLAATSQLPRAFSGSSTAGYEWRQRQLEKLEQKFNNTPPTEIVESDDDLQSMWRSMEGRVTNRRPRTAEETGGKTGRVNIKQTDEEYWLREGLYDNGNDDEDDSGEDSSTDDK